MRLNYLLVKSIRFVYKRIEAFNSDWIRKIIETDHSNTRFQRIYRNRIRCLCFIYFSANVKSDNFAVSRKSIFRNRFQYKYSMEFYEYVCVIIKEIFMNYYSNNFP